MSSLKHWLRRDVGPLFVKYSGVKIPLTLLSVSSLWAIRRELAGAFWAPWLNSLLTQVIEFLLLRNKVFQDPNKGWRIIVRQITLFWGWALLMASIEGWTMSTLEGYGWTLIPSYIVGHIPTFFLRFYGDRKFVFPKQSPPSSH